MLCGHSLYLYDDEQRKDAYELTEKSKDHIDALDLPLYYWVKCLITN